MQVFRSLRTAYQFLLFAALGASAFIANAADTQSLDLRLFDSSRGAAIDVWAQVQGGYNRSSVLVSELEPDGTTRGGAFEVPFRSIAALPFGAEYPFQQPVCRVYLGLAGARRHIGRVADSDAVEEGLRAALLPFIQGKAVECVIVDPTRPQPMFSVNIENAAADLRKCARNYAKSERRIFDTPRVMLSTVVTSVLQQAVSPNANVLLPSVLVVLTADMSNEGAEGIEPRLLTDQRITLAIGELERNDSAWSTRDLMGLCRATGGDYARCYKKPADIQMLVAGTIDRWKERVRGDYLLTATTRNPDGGNVAHFRVELLGVSIARDIRCPRKQEVVASLEKDIIQQVRTDLQKARSEGRFEDAARIIETYERRVRAGRELDTERQLTAAAFAASIKKAGENGEDREARARLHAPLAGRILATAEILRIDAEVCYLSAHNALDKGNLAHALDMFEMWRSLAEKAGTLTESKARDAAVCRRLLEVLVKDSTRKERFASEMNRLAKVDADVAMVASPILQEWVNADRADRREVSVRLGLLDDWGLVLTAVAGNEQGAASPAGRFLMLALNDPRALESWKELRKTSLAGDSPAPGYVSLTRAIGYSKPLVAALKAGPKLGLGPEEILQGWHTALTGFNDREDVFHRPGTTERTTGCHFVKDSAAIFGKDEDDFGYGVRLDRTFVRRLHDLGEGAVFVGQQNKSPVHLLLVPTGPSWMRLVFTDQVSPGVDADRKNRRRQLREGGKSAVESMVGYMDIQDLREAEWMAHLGVEALGQFIAQVGCIEAAEAGVAKSVEALFNGVPETMRVSINLAVGERDTQGVWTPLPAKSMRLPVDERAAKVGPLPPVAYVRWNAPNFEIYVPLRKGRDKMPNGVLTLVLKTLPR